MDRSTMKRVWKLGYRHICRRPSLILIVGGAIAVVLCVCMLPSLEENTASHAEWGESVHNKREFVPQSSEIHAGAPSAGFEEEADSKELLQEGRVNSPEVLKERRGASSTSSAETPTPERLLIREAFMHFRVNIEPFSLQKEVEKVATDLGGFIMSLSASTGNVEIVLRVPETQFSMALNHLRRLVRDRRWPSMVTLVSESLNSRDVTQEQVDDESRRRNLASAISQLRELMKNATSVTDVMQLLRELTPLTETEEMIIGRLRHRFSQANFSTIHVTIQRDVSQTVTTLPPPRTAWYLVPLVQFLKVLSAAGLVCYNIVVWVVLTLLVLSPFLLMAVCLLRRMERALGSATTPPGNDSVIE